MSAKKAKAADAKKAEPGPAGASPAADANAQKELLLIQIKDLRDKLDRQTKRCEDLQVENAKLQKQIDSDENAKQMVIEHLEASLADKQQRLSELERRRGELERELATTREQLEVQGREMRAQFDEQLAELRRELAHSREEIDELNEFRLHKDELAKSLEKLNDDKEHERKEHKLKMYELEREVVKEKERLKREMDGQLGELRQQMLSLAHSRLQSATKQTMLENEQMAGELQLQSRQTQDVIADNARLRDETRQLKRDLQLLHDESHQMALDNRRLSQQLKAANARLKELDEKQQQVFAKEQRNVPGSPSSSPGGAGHQAIVPPLASEHDGKGARRRPESPLSAASRPQQTESTTSVSSTRLLDLRISELEGEQARTSKELLEARQDRESLRDQLQQVDDSWHELVTFIETFLDDNAMLSGDDPAAAAAMTEEMPSREALLALLLKLKSWRRQIKKPDALPSIVGQHQQQSSAATQAAVNSINRTYSEFAYPLTAATPTLSSGELPVGRRRRSPPAVSVGTQTDSHAAKALLLLNGQHGLPADNSHLINAVGSSLGTFGRGTRSPLPSKKGF